MNNDLYTLGLVIIYYVFVRNIYRLRKNKKLSKKTALTIITVALIASILTIILLNFYSPS